MLNTEEALGSRWFQNSVLPLKAREFCSFPCLLDDCHRVQAKNHIRHKQKISKRAYDISWFNYHFLYNYCKILHFDTMFWANSGQGVCHLGPISQNGQGKSPYTLFQNGRWFMRIQIGPYCLVQDKIFFWILSLRTRHQGLIWIKTKEYLNGGHFGIRSITQE